MDNGLSRSVDDDSDKEHDELLEEAEVRSCERDVVENPDRVSSPNNDSKDSHPMDTHRFPSRAQGDPEDFMLFSLQLIGLAGGPCERCGLR